MIQILEDKQVDISLSLSISGNLESVSSVIKFNNLSTWVKKSKFVAGDQMSQYVKVNSRYLEE